MDNTRAFYDSLISKFKKIIEENSLGSEQITVTEKVLTPEEAPGEPYRRDFPLLTGKERLMEADFSESAGVIAVLHC